MDMIRIQPTQRFFCGDFSSRSETRWIEPRGLVSAPDLDTDPDSGNQPGSVFRNSTRFTSTSHPARCTLRRRSSEDREVDH